MNHRSIHDQIRRSIGDGLRASHATSDSGTSRHMDLDYSQSTDRDGDYSRRTNSGGSSDNEAVQIAQREDKAVHRSRAAVLLVLLVSGSVLGGISFWVGRRAEKEACYTQFDNLASEVVTMSQDKVLRVFDVMGTLSVTVTSMALHANMNKQNYNRERHLAIFDVMADLENEDSTTTNNEDPTRASTPSDLSSADAPNTNYNGKHSYPPGFITLPDVEQHFGTARAVSEAFVIAYLPLVEEEDRESWQNYSVQHQEWIWQANHNGREGTPDDYEQLDPIADQIWAYPPKNATRRQLEQGGGCDEDDEDLDDHGRKLSTKTPIVEPVGTGPYSPVWLLSPPPKTNDTFIVNYNMRDKPVFDKSVSFVNYTRKPTFLDVCTQTKWFGAAPPKGRDDPQTVVVQPVFEDFEVDARIVGHLAAVVPWTVFLEDILANNEHPVHVVLSNTCDEVLEYRVVGTEAFFLGEQDTHNPKYDSRQHSSIFADFANSQELVDAGHDHCVYTIRVYLTDDMMEAYQTSQPFVYVGVVVSIFIFTAIVFVVYDTLVGRRQAIVLSSAKKTHALVSSLFPKTVQDRMLNPDTATAIATTKSVGSSIVSNNLLDHNQQGRNSYSNAPPIADLFPETTVCFMDIAGFTSWSSMRQPSEVFMLLETLYYEFDLVAKRRRVFKVETIGDCYVAVCGLPDPVADHPVVMSRFAMDCLSKMHKVTKDLEASLGVGTADLGLRVGLHSGPVTAGVLRGERARFQLFGDTMNTAARMESTGVKNMIQVSQETADRLIAEGRSKWLKQREDQVEAKGKGLLNTWFLVSGRDGHASSTPLNGASTAAEKSEQLSVPMSMNSSPSSSPNNNHVRESIKSRFVEYNTDMLKRTLQLCMIQREAEGTKPSSMEKIRRMEQASLAGRTMVLDEFLEVVDLSEGGPIYSQAMHQPTTSSVGLSKEAQNQLRHFVEAIANSYLDNPFHNFEHASHVCMSANKLMARIVAHHLNTSQMESASPTPESIISDPLVQFTIILSALMHDVEHPGITNSMLVEEQHPLAIKYGHQSIAEQHSVDVAWKMLLSDRYKDIRRAIYTTEREFVLFRSVLVNAVMATDIVNKELGDLRKARWNKAFAAEATIKEGPSTSVNRKATIVIEHIIQASDVSHTMQHWHIYRKWNARLFQEMYKAFKEGRCDRNPVDGWYEGEIGFFDFYVIPLAKKLKECAVFGVSSDEYLSYAERNREEWKRRGADIVAEMQRRIEEDCGRVANSADA